MQEIKITYRIGGDDWTADDDLYFKIYNNSILFHTTGSSNSDSNVSVVDGIATIFLDGLTDGSTYNFTISEVDGDGLEGLVSNNFEISISGSVPIQTIAINTDSSDSVWTPGEIINSGDDITWDVNGAQVQILSGNEKPVFDLSVIGTPVITGSSFTKFIGLTKFVVDNLEITSIDILEATKLIEFSCKGDYSLNALDVSTLLDLELLTFRSQNLTSIDLSNNTKLIKLWGYSNFLTTISLSNNTNLELIYLYTNSLGSDALDNIVNDLDGHGLSSGDLKIVSNSGNITSASQPGYDNLKSKGWSIDVDPPPNTSNTVIEMVNFNITNANPDRVYFGTSKVAYTADINITGFKIEGKTISSVTVNNGGMSGHYFTLSDNLNFWDSVLVRLENGTSNVYDFLLRYIENNINEPTSSIPYFVGLNGNDTNDGLTKSTAWRTITHAANVVTNDSVVWVMAGDYGNENVSFSNNGLINKPIKFIGYKEIEGDAIELDRRYLFDGLFTNRFDSSEMPLITNGNITCGKEYIIFKNIQVKESDSTSKLINIHGSMSVMFQNCYTDGGAFGIWQYSGNDLNETNHGNTKVIRCYVSNSTTAALRLRNYGNVTLDTWAVSTRLANQDYYINYYDGRIGHSNVIRNCYCERVYNDNKGGPHAISLKGAEIGDHADNKLAYNLIENNIIESIRGAIEYRHTGTWKCVGRNNTCLNNVVPSDKGNAGGIKFVDSAHDNIEENSTFIGVDFGIKFRAENEAFSVPDGNKVRNCIFDDCGVFLSVELDFTDANESNPVNSDIYNNTIYNCGRMTIMESSLVLDNSNKIRNNLINGVSNGIDSADNSIYTYNNGWDYWLSNGTPISGTGNKSINPSFITFPTPTNASLKAGVAIAGLEYDMEGLERENPPTIGAIEI